MATSPKSAPSGVAVYARVSTRRQDLASQLPDLKRYEATQQVEADWFTDKATGKSLDRPGFERLMAMVRAGRISTIVIWRLDRLGRTASGLTALFEELRSRKVNLVSIKDGLDFSSAAGRLMANVLASVAAFETEVRSERVFAGLAAARDRGTRLGRPPGVSTRIKVTPEQETMARRLKAEGQGVTSVARATGLSRPTVYSILRASA